MAIVTDIADAVVTELNAADFGQSIDAERHYVPDFELPEMKSLHVSVVPKAATTNVASRGLNQRDYQVDVAVQRKLETSDNAELDELLGLTESIGDHFGNKRLKSYPTAMWVRTEHKPIYSVEHIEQFRQFTSVLTFTFRVMK